MGYRPRGSLARSLQNKCAADERLRRIDKNEWYQVEMEYLPRCLKSTFVQLGPDEETEKFLQLAEDKSSWLVTQMWHTLVKTLLGFFLTQTSINGLLHRGSMFVFSRQQYLTMTTILNVCLQFPNSTETANPRRLLDIGAGDGAVTSIVDKMFDEVYVTEVSPPMRWILASKGFKILEVETWTEQNIKFDVIFCLNLLDRCDKPLDILASIRKSLQPGGLLVLALVLPFKPYVETGSRDHIPSQNLCISGYRFEDQVNSLVHNVLGPAGFSVAKWSRVPYLCEGDIEQSYYWLDDALLVLTSDTETLHEEAT